MLIRRLALALAVVTGLAACADDDGGASWPDTSRVVIAGAGGAGVRSAPTVHSGGERGGRVGTHSSGCPSTRPARASPSGDGEAGSCLAAPAFR